MLLNVLAPLAIWILGSVDGRLINDPHAAIIMKVLESMPYPSELGEHEPIATPCNSVSHDDERSEIRFIGGGLRPFFNNDELSFMMNNERRLKSNDEVNFMLNHERMRLKDISRRYITALREELNLLQGFKGLSFDDNPNDIFRKQGEEDMRPRYMDLHLIPRPIPIPIPPPFLDYSDLPKLGDFKKQNINKQFAALRKLMRNVIENFEERRRSFII